MSSLAKWPIDRNKLTKELSKRGFHSYHDFALFNGYQRNWLNNQLLKGVINRPTLVALEKAGISYEDIKPAEQNPAVVGGGSKPTAKAPGPKTVKDITPDELYSVMFKAFRDALNSD